MFHQMVLGLRVFLLSLLIGCVETPDDDTDDVICVDNDGDGVDNCEDCDDNDPNSYPGAEEHCDGVDNNCDGDTHYEGDGGQECATCDTQGLFYLTQLKSGLSEALVEATDGVSCTYSNATRYMFTALDKSDGQVECVYTGRKVSVGTDKPDADDMNTEHTWPQSQGAQSIPAKCDLHHLFPTDSDANQLRADHPLDEVVSGTSWSQGGSQLGLNAAGDEVFEPRDSHKGNAARAILYFANRYGHSLSDHELERYTAWHTLDPVDATETSRTEEIFRRQGNPNPLVFCPILVEQLAAEAL